MQRLVTSVMWRGRQGVAAGVERNGRGHTTGPDTGQPQDPSSHNRPTKEGAVPLDGPKEGVDRGSYELERCEQRRRWVEEFTGTELPSLAGWWGPAVHEEPAALEGNIEGPIGLVRIPVACAGPILVHGKHAQGLYVVPMATTEGALLASTSRGATAINASGGVQVNAYRQRMLRTPVFFCESPEQAERLGQWIKGHLAACQEIVKTVSQHGRLTDVDFFTDAEILHVRFIYTTGEAAGQNLVTAVTWKVVEWLLQEVRGEFPPELLNVRDFSVESTLSGDKRQSSLNLLHGRGISAIASVVVPEEVLQSVLKVSSEALLRLCETAGRLMHGFGMTGPNFNACNLLAAVYAATGQDIACIVEGSECSLSLRPASGTEGGVLATLRMPSLVVGTVGGGTALPTQQDCLKMMHCTGPGSSFRLAEIIAASTLGLELSLASALASGQFARAHERLGRNRPALGVRPHHISDRLFQQVLNHLDAELIRWEPFGVDSSSSILSDMTASDPSISKLIGHFAFNLQFKPRLAGPVATPPDDEPGADECLSLVLKCKGMDSEVIHMLNKIATGIGEPLASAFDAHKDELGFRHCHRRELAVAALAQPEVRDISPSVFHIWENPSQEIHAFCMEHLGEEGFSHLSTVNDVGLWSDDDRRTVLRDLSAFHAVYFDREESLADELGSCLNPADTAHSMKEKMPLWLALLGNNAREYPDIWTPAREAAVRDMLADVDRIWSVLESQPKTLVHNDFNSRNVCLRREPRRLCAYDWELAAVNAPQHDLVEFLAFTVDPCQADGKFPELAEFYRQQLAGRVGAGAPASRWLESERFAEVLDYCAFNLLIQRLALYSMTQDVKHFPFLPRIVGCVFSYLRSRAARYPHLRLGEV